MNLRAVAWLLGCVLLLLAGFMLVPALVAAGYGEGDAFYGCLLSAVITAVIGGFLVVFCRGATITEEGRADYFRREGLAAVGCRNRIRYDLDGCLAGCGLYVCPGFEPIRPGGPAAAQSQSHAHAGTGVVLCVARTCALVWVRSVPAGRSVAGHSVSTIPAAGLMCHTVGPLSTLATRHPSSIVMRRSCSLIGRPTDGVHGFPGKRPLQLPVSLTRCHAVRPPSGGVSFLGRG